MQPEPKADTDQQRPDREPLDRRAQSAAPRGRPFVKGQSGNLAGRPSRAAKAAYVAGALIANKTVPLTTKLIDLALAGDRAALRMCLDRIAPPPREAPVALDLPPLMNGGDLADAIAAVIDAAATGILPPTQAAKLVGTMLTLLQPAPTWWTRSLLDSRPGRGGKPRPAAENSSQHSPGMTNRGDSGKPSQLE